MALDAADKARRKSSRELRSAITKALGPVAAAIERSHDAQARQR
jgi:hypothetical protein